MTYKIMTLNKKEERNILMENLSEEDINIIKENIEWLKMVMLSKDFYVMLRDNVEELLAYIPRIDIKNKYTFDDLNRYMYNTLGSFYALIEYYEHNFKTMFTTIKSNYFDTYWEYRIMYALRVYTTHRGPAITSYRVAFNDDKSASIDIIVKPGELLQNFSKFNKIIKNELQEMEENGEEIEIYNTVTGFKEMMSKFHKDLLKALENEAQVVMKSFVPYLVYEQGKAIDSYILDENDKIVENITNSLKLFVQKMSNPY